MTKRNAMQTVKEGLAEILCDSSVFYNPVQEFNRDLSIAAINCHLETIKEKDARILEGLSATGLRSVRYAKELVHPRLSILANDFDKAAVESIKENIIHNNVSHMVKASHGDAKFDFANPSYIMLKSLHENAKFQIIDLDPYGSASQFIDAAVQSIDNGGIILVTCTDMGVLAGGQTETNFAKYGGVNLTSTPYCHEFALRSVLHCLNTSATRYKKMITPLVSMSIDFYVRLVVKVDHSPKLTKEAASKTSLVYHCHYCKSFFPQSLGLVLTEGNSTKYKTNRIPTASIECRECNNPFTVAGPFWGSKIHQVEFVEKMLGHIKDNPKKYGTESRMIGFLTVIKEELQDVPFYYTVSALANAIHCITPKLNAFLSAILNAGYKASLTHCAQTSVKTDAPSGVIWDIMRCWVKNIEAKNPVKKIQGTPAARILDKHTDLAANFSKHPDCEAESKKIKLVRFQNNPEANWGPKQKAKKAKQEDN